MIEEPNELDARPQSRREWSGWLRSIVLPLAILAVIVGGLVYYQSRRDASVAHDGFGSVALPDTLNVTGKPPSAETDRAAPDFLLRSLDGGTLRLSDLQGKPVLVNFWATWCSACRQELPELIEAQMKHGPAGLTIVGVDLREAVDKVQPFVDNFQLPYPIALDRDGEVARTWRIGGPSEGLPSSYFIDADGVVRKVVFGALTTKTLDEGLALILEPSS